MEATDQIFNRHMTDEDIFKAVERVHDLEVQVAALTRRVAELERNTIPLGPAYSPDHYPKMPDHFLTVTLCSSGG